MATPQHFRPMVLKLNAQGEDERVKEQYRMGNGCEAIVIPSDGATRDMRGE